MAEIKTSTENRLSEAIAGMEGIFQSLEHEMTMTDDDGRLINLSCILAKANRAMSDLASARLLYRKLESGEYVGGDADV